METLNGGTVPEYHCRHFSLGLPGRLVQKTDTLDLFPSSVWEPKIEGLESIYCISVSCSIWNFQPDILPQNWTVRLKTGHRVTLLKNMSQLIFQSFTELWIFYFLTYSVPSLNSNCRYHVADQCWQHRDVCMSALSSMLVTAIQCKWMKNTSHTSTLTQTNRAAYLV